MHVSRCIIRDAELIAFEWGWMDGCCVRRMRLGMEGKTENRMWRDMKATVVQREVSRRRLGLHSDKHI